MTEGPATPNNLSEDLASFSAEAREFIVRPYHYGVIPYGKNLYADEWRSQCGDTMKIYLKIENGIIADTSFEIEGCMTMLIVGSQLIKLIEYQSVSIAWTIQDHDVWTALGKFPPEKYHCCTLAVGALKKTLAQYKQLYG